MLFTSFSTFPFKPVFFFKPLKSNWYKQYHYMKKTIIYILDHNSSQGSFLKYQLVLSGFRNIQHFLSPEECLYSLDKERIPDFIVIDPDYPGMNAEKFVQKVKFINPAIKVFIFSRKDDPGYAALLLRSGAIDYIVRNGNDRMSINELTSNILFLIKENKFAG
jgi:DNA-binding NtrC family response regulator